MFVGCFVETALLHIVPHYSSLYYMESLTQFFVACSNGIVLCSTLVTSSQYRVPASPCSVSSHPTHFNYTDQTAPRSDLLLPYLNTPTLNRLADRFLHLQAKCHPVSKSLGHLAPWQDFEARSQLTRKAESGSPGTWPHPIHPARPQRRITTNHPCRATREATFLAHLVIWARTHRLILGRKSPSL